MPQVQYFPFPVGSIVLFRAKYMKLTFWISVPNIYEVTVMEQLRLFTARACFAYMIFLADSF